MALVVCENVHAMWISGGAQTRVQHFYCYTSLKGRGHIACPVLKLVILILCRVCGLSRARAGLVWGEI